MRIVLLILAITCVVRANGKDYIDYHKAINKAERQIFVSKQVDSGINTYLKTFKEFDFVYLSDCITVMQIALHVYNEKAFKEIINKATQNGLMPRHLVDFTYINKHPYYAKYKIWIDSVYKINRPHYLERIDTAVLKRMTFLYADDQLQKNFRKDGKESPTQNRRRYAPHIKETIDQIKQIVFTKGFPYDKMIGIYQKDIIRELKLGTIDLYEYYNKYRHTNEFSIHIGQFDLDEGQFASGYFNVLMHHYDQAFYLFDTIFYKKQIALGNIHPKDVARIHDFQFDVGSDPPLPSKGSLYFGLMDRLMGTGERIPLRVSDTIVNRSRALYYIPPVEKDRAKWDFMRQHKMFYAFGDMGGRM